MFRLLIDLVSECQRSKLRLRSLSCDLDGVTRFSDFQLHLEAKFRVFKDPKEVRLLLSIYGLGSNTIIAASSLSLAAAAT